MNLRNALSQWFLHKYIYTHKEWYTSKGKTEGNIEVSSHVTSGLLLVQWNPHPTIWTKVQ